MQRTKFPPRAHTRKHLARRARAGFRKKVAAPRHPQGSGAQPTVPTLRLCTSAGICSAVAQYCAKLLLPATRAKQAIALPGRAGWCIAAQARGRGSTTGKVPRSRGEKAESTRQRRTRTLCRRSSHHTNSNEGATLAATTAPRFATKRHRVHAARRRTFWNEDVVDAAHEHTKPNARCNTRSPTPVATHAHTHPHTSTCSAHKHSTASAVHNRGRRTAATTAC